MEFSIPLPFTFFCLAWVAFLTFPVRAAASQQPTLLDPKPSILRARGNTSSDAQPRGYPLPLFSRPIPTSSSVLLNLLALKRMLALKRTPAKAALLPPRPAGAPSTAVGFRYNISLVVEVQVGTPPQKQLMVVDTGSEISWLQCAPARSSKSFNPKLSASYSAVPCKSPVCTRQASDFPIPATCDANRLCHYTTSYADGTSSEGNLARETISIAPVRGSPLKVPGFVFGCVSSALPQTPGLMGLNRGALSFVSQMRGRSVYKFSYCIANRFLRPNSPGVLYFGESPFARELKYTPLITLSVPLPYFNRAAYSLRLQAIKVGEKVLPIPKSVFEPDHTGAGQTMIDSGTQFTFLLGEAYRPLREAFLQQNGAGRGLNPMGGGFAYEGVLDLCYNRPANQPFPQVSPVALLFDSAQLTLGSHQLLYRIPGQAGTVYCFTFGNSDLVPVEANIIGNHQQQDVWIEYDLQNSRVGFAPAKCDIG